MISVYVGGYTGKERVEFLDAESISVSRIVETVQSLDLFGEKKTYRIRGGDAEAVRDDLVRALSEMAEAPNDVVIVLDKLLAADRKKIEKYATIHESKAKPERKEEFNAFALANAFASGDRKKSWIVFQELLSHDDEMEKTHGMIWWKLKDMMTKRSPYSAGEMKDVARKLVAAYHESRLGGLSLEQRLEEFLLTLPETKK